MGWAGKRNGKLLTLAAADFDVLITVDRNLARIVYFTLKHGWTYVDKGAKWYEQQFRQRLLKSLQSRALQLGYTLTPVPKAG